MHGSAAAIRPSMLQVFLSSLPVWLQLLTLVSLDPTLTSADDATEFNLEEGDGGSRRLTTGLPANLALGMPVSLSRAYASGSDVSLAYSETHPVTDLTITGAGSKMTDGDRGTDFLNGGGCAETVQQPDPWARIDFGREVPMAMVKLWTRTDVFRKAANQLPGLYPIELYVGNQGEYWFENLICASGVQLSRAVQPVQQECLASGRYLFIVLRGRGYASQSLSLCEVEVSPKGPLGTKSILQTVGVMWSLRLDGLALHRNDRIRIVADTLYCGRQGSSQMDSAVLALTAPHGQRRHGDYTMEIWEFVQINRMGLYKVCWCGNFTGIDCTRDAHFNAHVATININGLTMTAVGQEGKNPADWGEVINVSTPDAMLDSPYGVAAAPDRVYFSESEGNRVRYFDLATQTVRVLCGGFYYGTEGDFGPAKDAKLFHPRGIALSKDHQVLYIADSGSHRVRKILVSGNNPQDGIISTVAGNGFPGFTGDGDNAVDAQLNSPTCVNVDANEMLWICDTGNNRVRVVSLGDQLFLVPGTNIYREKIILTAVGDGIQGSKGDSGLDTAAQTGAPAAIYVSSGFLSNDIGNVPAVAYIAEEATDLVRAIDLEYKSYIGYIRTLSGKSYDAGYQIVESKPLESKNTRLDSPKGIVANNGVLYVSDTANNRLLMYPLIEWISIGCWRENHRDAWIPLIEPAEGTTDEFLDLTPEQRTDPIRKCAYAALERGYEAFAIRQWGYCAAGPSVLLDYKREGSSTSCSNGLGGARDNSVYRFAREGYEVKDREQVFVLAGRGHLREDGIYGFDGYGGDGRTAWRTEMSGPTGLAVNPATNDIWFADTGNDVVRMIFSQLGPNRFHEMTCLNGYNCIVSLMGNAMQPEDKLAVFPSIYQCGQEESQFETFFKKNPVHADHSLSFTHKVFDFGEAEVLIAGEYRLCYCSDGASLFGKTVTCIKPTDFVMDAGVLHIEGPNFATLYVHKAGVPFDIAVFGKRFLQQDRVRLVRESQICGLPGANATDAAVLDKSKVDTFRRLGNADISVWPNVSVWEAGNFNLCWCQGAIDASSGDTCYHPHEFAVFAARFYVLGPTFANMTLHMSHDEGLVLQGVGFNAGDRMRIVDSTQACGKPGAERFSASVENMNGVPGGRPDKITSNSEEWAFVQMRENQKVFHVCWCGSLYGCIKGEDFNILAAAITPIGPTTRPFLKIEEARNMSLNRGETNPFAVTINTTHTHGREKMRIVDSFTKCGSDKANISTVDLNSSQPEEPNYRSATELTWDYIQLTRQGIYRICYCACAYLGDPVYQCCSYGPDFYLEVGAIYVDTPLSLYNPPAWTQDAGTVDTDRTPRPAVLWGAVPKDYGFTYSLRVKTRDAPAHAGSKGPIHVYMMEADSTYEADSTTGSVIGTAQSIAMERETNNLFPFPVVLTGLEAGELQVFNVTYNLPYPKVPKGIMIESHTTDAWFCEEIIIEISNLTVSMGENRFSCGSWTVDPAHREARRVTDESDPWLQPPLVLPEAMDAIWERRFFQIDACGGCDNGYECVEVDIPLETRVNRVLNETFLFTFGVSDYILECKGICGDGLAVAGEQCDDGNLNSLDGCNALCQVEEQFECANFDDSPSRCFLRMCNAQVRGSWYYNYWTHYNDGDAVGWACEPSTPVNRMPPAEHMKICYKWDEGVVPQAPDTTIGGRRRRTIVDPTGICPAGIYNNRLEQVKAYSFNPERGTRVNCPGYQVDFKGHTKKCNVEPAQTWFAPAGRHMYLTQEACYEACFYDTNCAAASYNVKASPGGYKCPDPPNMTLAEIIENCGATCDFHSDCDIVDNDHPELDRDEWRIALKEKLPEFTETYLCVEGHRPRPGWAFERAGMISVQFDSPVELPVGVALYENFRCSRILAPSSQASVGGGGVPCRFVDNRTMVVMLGAHAYINQPMAFDKHFQFFGHPAFLAIDSRLVRPQGLVHDYWHNYPFEEFRVRVRRTKPESIRDGGMPDLPRVVIRGPFLLGGCATLQLFAGSSYGGGGRRWRSAKWHCVETRPDPSLPMELQMLAYAACASHIQPYLDEKPWCDHSKLNPSVAEPCEMRISIPPALWCGLRRIRFACTLTSAAGDSSTAFWDTDIDPLARIPVALPVGPSVIHMSPQKYENEDVPRLRLEVATDNDIENIDKCECNLSARPTFDSKEGELAIEWLHGPMYQGVPPRQDALQPVVGDESRLTNVLTLPIKGILAWPNSSWQYVARVGYKWQQRDRAGLTAVTDATLVRFTVHIGPLEAPNAAIRAPAKVYSTDCSFEVNALETRVREVLYWSTRRLTETGEDKPLPTIEDVYGPQKINKADASRDRRKPSIEDVYDRKKTGKVDASKDRMKSRFLQANTSVADQVAAVLANLGNGTSQNGTMTNTADGFLSQPRPQYVKYSWRCMQMAQRRDDGPILTVDPDVSDLLNDLCGNSHSNRIEVPIGSLPPGLYLFTVIVEDGAVPGVTSETNVTVESEDKTISGLWSRPIPRQLRPNEDAFAEFWNLQRGSGCSGLPDGRHMLFMRGIMGRPDSEMIALGNISYSFEDRRFPEVPGLMSRIWIFHANISRKLLHPGFKYAFRVLTTSMYPEKIKQYEIDLLANKPNVSGVDRIITTIPAAPPEGIWVHQTNSFSVYGGPISGSLECTHPANGMGFSMQTLFRFEQIWATDEPPLEYAFYYAKVPEDRRSDFDAERAKGFDDEEALERLRALVPGQKLSVLSEWTRDPIVEMPLPLGMYLIEGHVRDQHGVNNSRAILVESKSLFDFNQHVDTLTTSVKLAQLDTYIQDSMGALLSVRAANKAASAVVPLCGGVQELPNFDNYDFRAMKQWSVVSPYPAPILSQPIYGTPIVSTETRKKVVTYMKELLVSLRSLLVDMDDKGFRTPHEVVEGPPAGGLERLLLQVTVQPNHVEIIAAALRRLAESIEPLDEQELYLSIAQLVTLLLVRLRTAQGTFECSDSAVSDLLHAIAALLAGCEPAMIPRSGVIFVNKSDTLQAKLSRELFLGIDQLSDYVAACANFDVITTLQAALPRGAQGALKLTVHVVQLITVIETGVKLSPDYQSMETWPYPRLEIKPLGQPGFEARAWAGDPAQTYKMDGCYSSSEAFLERVALTVVAWPLSPLEYTRGDLIDVKNNMTSEFSIKLRSCGESLVVNKANNSIHLIFRMDPEIVRDKRWGFGDKTPYKAKWWEDAATADGKQRTRQWTDNGCRTGWGRNAEDIINVTCDRLPGISAGSVYGIELLPRPPYFIEPEPFDNASINNVVSYLLVLLCCRWLWLWYFAHKGDLDFFPDENELMAIHFLPAEYNWREAKRKGRAIEDEASASRSCCSEIGKSLSAAACQKFLMACKGNPVFLSLEVQELAVMRAGKRSDLYETFFLSLDERERAPEPKIPEHLALPAPTSEGGDNASLAALQDDVTRGNSKWSAPSSAWSKAQSELQDRPTKFPSKASALTAPMIMAGSDPDMRLAIQEEEAEDAMEYEDGPQMEQTMMPEGLPEGWEVLFDSEGHMYYLNTVSNETQWELPVVPAVEANVMTTSNKKSPSQKRGHKLGTLKASASCARARMGEEEDEQLALLDNESSHGNQRPRQLQDTQHRSIPPDQCLPGQVDSVSSNAIGRVLVEDGLHGTGPEDDVELRSRLATDSRLAAENPANAPLPMGWEMHRAANGREFFTYPRGQITQWHPPRLPPHWEERLSSRGQVYYLSLFDGHTQWDWPQETTQMSRQEVEIPGSVVTNTMPMLEPPPASSDSLVEFASETGKEDVVDMLDAGVLLCMELEQVSRSSTPATSPRHAIVGVGATTEGDKDCKAAHIAQQPKWGEDTVAKAWKELHGKLEIQKAVHARKNAESKAFQGLREFVHTYELHDQVNNWERQFHNVHEKLDNIDRKKAVMGVREELEHEDLRLIFPIIQRLEWTKWTTGELFVHCMVRSIPTAHLFCNVARPTKFQRCTVHLLFVAVALLFSTIMLSFKADISEDITAMDTPVWTLFGQVFSSPFNVNVLWVAVVADIVAAIIRDLCIKVFFGYSLPPNRRPPMDEKQRTMQLMLWHAMADLGKWVCNIGIVLAVVATLVLCAFFPQPRAANVVRTFLLLVLWAYLAKPLLKGFATTFILTTARTSAAFDGLLTNFPDIMDFVHVGVKTPAFLVWRIEKIVTQKEMMRRVHHEPPDIGDESSESDDE